MQWTEVDVRKGELSVTPLPGILRQLAEEAASGALHVSAAGGAVASVLLRAGQVCDVEVPGTHPQLGARLVSSGALGPEGLAEVLEVQRKELQDWQLGELLVHLGYVEQPVVDAFVQEQLLAAAGELLQWSEGSWTFRVDESACDDVAPPIVVEALLAQVELRRLEWEVIDSSLHGAGAVPVLSASGSTDAEVAIDPEAWSLLCMLDGLRTVAELATECGFTVFEAGSVVLTLVRSGLVEVEWVPAQIGPGRSITHRLTAAFMPAAPVPALLEAPAPQARLEPDDGSCTDTSVDWVCTALSALQVPVTDESLFAAPATASMVHAADREAEVVHIVDVRREPAEAEQARLAEQALHTEVSEVLAELTASAAGDDRGSRASGSAAPDEPVALDVGRAVDPGSAAARTIDRDDYPVRSYDDNTDTAALLRELSSLGLEDEASGPTLARPAPRTSVSPLTGKRKKGLFGR